MLKRLAVSNFNTVSGVDHDIQLSYQLFGRPLHTAPIVLVNHALTGNSQVTGEKGWWSDLIGKGKCIDTAIYTVLAFNIPGNCYDGFVINNYQDFVARDIASLFLEGLQRLQIKSLYAIIGGSLGGGIGWEMIALNPDISQHLVPIASDWKSTDWLIANCRIQEQFLVNSTQPIQDARMHAMLCYRTPQSLNRRFERTVNEELQVFNVESWLMHHGEKLQNRFQLSAYKLMNQLLRTIDIVSRDAKAIEGIAKSKVHIHVIGVDTDLFFTAEENRNTYHSFKKLGCTISYGEITSIHGHDAFLIEFPKLEELLAEIFIKKPKAWQI
ncbi:MAG: alpha/beta fold hydrolase [Bacteroidota bacterium]